MSGALHLIIGSLALAFALLILRADPGRWDNRAFAILGVLDAATALFRGVAEASGASLLDRDVMLPCALIAPLLAWATIEFAWSFPFSRPLPWRWRIPVALWSGSAIAVLASSPEPWLGRMLSFAFFMPVMVVFMALQVRNLRRMRGDRAGVRLVLIALALRWVTANTVYPLRGVVTPETWEVMLWIESTVVVLLSFVLIGLANVRSNLFTMRSAAGELLLESAFVLSGLVLTAAGVAAAGRLAETWPRVETPLLMLSTMVPLGVYAIAERLRPRLEAGIDPRRARRREVLESAAADTDPTDPDAVAAAATVALTEISAGGTAAWRPAAQLDDELRAELAAGPHRTADELAVPVTSCGILYGALTVTGGVVDRETIGAARLLAGRLATACDHRQLVGELEESRRLAALGAFAAAIAHDIRTPLTSVQMNVQMLRAKVDLPADDMEHFDIALTELRRLDDHVKELLDYAKPLQLRREPVELRDLADAAARTVEPLLTERGQVLRRDHADDLPPIPVDAGRVRQVLWNLLDNASRASADGATVELRTRRDGDRVAIDVIDHGAGIADADQPRIFEPFFTTRPDGTGLGLAICQKVVRGHGGDIAVRSAPTGSTFTVTLPLAAR